MKRQEYAKIEPESICPGDTIEVIAPAVNGVTVRRRGVASVRESYTDATRSWYTNEGGELVKWGSALPRPAVFRIARAVVANPEPLFDIERLIDSV